MQEAPPFRLKHPCGVLIQHGLTEPHVRPLPGVMARDMGTGYVWCSLPRAEIAGQMISMSLCFFKHDLHSLRVAVLDDAPLQSWAEWSQEKERTRAEATRRWLAVVGYPVGKYSWGTVYAGTDPKTGDGGGGINFQ
jgi:hypothetical protein